MARKLEIAASDPSSRGGLAMWKGVPKTERVAHMTMLAVMRWAKTSKRRRSAYGRLAARARWDGKDSA